MSPEAIKNDSNNPPSTADILRTLAQEITAYLRDLSRLFTTELSEKVRAMGTMVALAGAALLFLLFSFCFLSLALIGAISYGLASWRWALLIVGVAWGVIGLLLLLPLAHAIRGGLLKFERTQRHLKEDPEFVKNKLAA